MTGPRLFVCRDARSTHWQLGPLPPPPPPDDGSFVLLGWSQCDDVHALLADALVSIARVTFMHDELDPPLFGEWRARGDDYVCALDGSSWTDWVRSASTRLGFSQELGMIATRRSARAAMLFDSGAFPWSLQSQVVLLSAREGAPPKVSGTTLRELVSHEWFRWTDAMRKAGFVAMMRPGVDGDVAGIISFDTAFENALLDALTLAARTHGASCDTVSETQLVDLLAM